MKKGDKILVVAAHPDDDVLGCGGIMSKYKNLLEFRVVFIAEGSSCRYNSPSHKQVKEVVKARTKMAKKALKILGISDYYFYNLPCGRLDTVPQIEINKIIENEISSFKPNVVITHSGKDTNMDHVKVYNSTMVACRPKNGIKMVLAMEILSSSEIELKNPFDPNLFFELSIDNLNQKCDAFKEYLTEIEKAPNSRNVNGIKTLAKYRGLQSGVMYAEAFNLIKQVK